MNYFPWRIIRYSWCLLFLWFGFQQLIDPGAWVSYLPVWTGYFPIPAEILIQLNGWLEIVLAVFLASGLMVRVVAIILSLHLMMIAVEAGGAIGVRDAVLAMMGVALAFTPADPWTLDSYYNKSNCQM